MKKLLLNTGILLGIAGFIFLGILLFGWVVSVIFNVVLGQMGLGRINFWGGCCILALAQGIKGFLKW